MSVRAGVDTGGAFTDLVVFEEEAGEIHPTPESVVG